jgi:hypothetical protein
MDGSFRTSALRIENPLSSGASYIFGERVILKQVDADAVARTSRAGPDYRMETTFCGTVTKLFDGRMKQKVSTNSVTPASPPFFTLVP